MNKTLNKTSIHQPNKPQQKILAARARTAPPWAQYLRGWRALPDRPADKEILKTKKNNAIIHNYNRSASGTCAASKGRLRLLVSIRVLTHSWKTEECNQLIFRKTGSSAAQQLISTCKAAIAASSSQRAILRTISDNHCKRVNLLFSFNKAKTSPITYKMN